MASSLFLCETILKRAPRNVEQGLSYVSEKCDQPFILVLRLTCGDQERLKQKQTVVRCSNLSIFLHLPMVVVTYGIYHTKTPIDNASYPTTPINPPVYDSTHVWIGTHRRQLHNSHTNRRGGRLHALGGRGRWRLGTLANGIATTTIARDGTR